MEVATFRAIAIMVSSLVIICFNSPFKQVTGFLDLIPDSWQIHQPEGRPVFIDQVFEGDPVESEVISTVIKAILRKVIALFNQIKIGVFHPRLNHKKPFINRVQIKCILNNKITILLKFFPENRKFFLN